MKGKQFLIGIAVLALIAVAYIAFDNSEFDEYVRGTIGAADTVVAGVEPADRYRSEQMTEDDVQLGDTELERLMQSEIIEELISNPAFARAIQDEAVRAAMEEEWAEAAFANEETREALAAIPIDEISAEVPIGDNISADIPIDDDGGDPSYGESYGELLEDDFVRDVLEDDALRDAVLDEYVQELVGEEWLLAALDHPDVQAWLKAATEEGNYGEFESDREREESEANREDLEEFEANSEDLVESAANREDDPARFETDNAGEDFRTDNAGEDFRTDNAGEDFRTDNAGEDFRTDNAGEDFRTNSEDLAEFAAATENEAFKRVLQKHPGLFRAIAEDPAYGRALAARVGDFQKLEAAFSRTILEKAVLRKALFEKTGDFLKVAELAKMEQFGKMTAYERAAFGKSTEFRAAIYEKAIGDFGKTGFGKSEGE